MTSLLLLLTGNKLKLEAGSWKLEDVKISKLNLNNFMILLQSLNNKK